MKHELEGQFLVDHRGLSLLEADATEGSLRRDVAGADSGDDAVDLWIFCEGHFADLSGSRSGQVPCRDECGRGSVR